MKTYKQHNYATYSWADASVSWDSRCNFTDEGDGLWQAQGLAVGIWLVGQVAGDLFSGQDVHGSACTSIDEFIEGVGQIAETNMILLQL